MTFLSPSWRLKGSLNDPKKVTNNCQVVVVSFCCCKSFYFAGFVSLVFLSVQFLPLAAQQGKVCLI